MTPLAAARRSLQTPVVPPLSSPLPGEGACWWWDPGRALLSSASQPSACLTNLTPWTLWQAQ